jgi:tetratricopeptide (TPR) repeat protein
VKPPGGLPLVPRATLLLLLGGVVGLQMVRERFYPRVEVVIGEELLYVRSPAVVARTALSFQSLVADAYWIRALQHYGRTRLSAGGSGRYELLYPLLDLTTSLDPHFTAAYRFGAIFLTEPPPGGPGRGDLALALLEKGLGADPGRWEYAQDAGFVHYRSGDYKAAASWFRRAAGIEGAPNWMLPLAAVTEARGGQRATSRQLWRIVVEGAGAGEEWLRKQADLRLQQLDAMDDIDALTGLIERHRQRTGRPAAAWTDLVSSGHIRQVPQDPRGFPYQLHPSTGAVTLDPRSTLNPLPHMSGAE